MAYLFYFDIFKKIPNNFNCISFNFITESQSDHRITATVAAATSAVTAAATISWNNNKFNLPNKLLSIQALFITATKNNIRT